MKIMNLGLLKYNIKTMKNIVRQQNFLKALTDLCRKHRFEIDIDVHRVQLTLTDLDYKKERFPEWDSLDQKEYKLNGSYDNFNF